MQCDMAALQPLISEIFESGKTVSLPVNGNSMHPFLEGGRDSVVLQRPQVGLKIGEVVVFKRGDGCCVLHRIIKIEADGRFFTAGDNCVEIEGPIEPQQLVADTVSAVRNGRAIKKGSAQWRFFAEHMTRRSRVRQLLGSLRGKN